MMWNRLRGSLLFSFAWPWVFVVLILPWFVYRFSKPVNNQQSGLKVPFFALLNRQNIAGHRVNKMKLAVLSLLWLLLITAGAKPLWLGEPQPVTNSVRDLMLAVDISGSMETKDMQLGTQMVDRLVGIKVVLDGFINKRTQDRMGLILFADNAYIQTPLTLDHRSLAKFLNEAQIGFAGQKTAIGDAIGLALKRMQDGPSKSRVLILLTDGANTAGTVTPLEAAAMAAKHNLKIYTLGFGADEYIVQSIFGNQRINPSADLDEDSLIKIAEMTGGQYFRARSIDELVEVYQLLDELEPQPNQGKEVVPQRSLFFWPLGSALLLSLLWAMYQLLSHWRMQVSIGKRSADDVR